MIEFRLNKDIIVNINRLNKPFKFNTSSESLSKYNYTIIFKNLIGMNLVTINCNEKDILDSVIALSAILSNPFEIISDIIHFDNVNNNNISHFIWVNVLEDSIHPLDDEEDVELQDVSLGIYEVCNGNQYLKLYITLTYSEFENLVIQLHTSISDIENVQRFNQLESYEYNMNTYGRNSEPFYESYNNLI